MKVQTVIHTSEGEYWVQIKPDLSIPDYIMLRAQGTLRQRGNNYYRLAAPVYRSGKHVYNSKRRRYLYRIVGTKIKFAGHRKSNY